MDKIKKGLVGSILISVILAVTLTYVWAVTPTTTFYINTGVYPGAPDFTIWVEGDNYFAKNKNGFTAYSGSDADVLINSVLTIGGHILLKAGDYETDQDLNVNVDYTYFEGEKNSRILCSNQNYGFLVKGDYVTIKGVWVNGTGQLAVNGFGICFESAKSGLVTECKVTFTGLDGIHFRYCSNCTAINNICEGTGDDSIAALLGENNAIIGNHIDNNNFPGTAWIRGITVASENGTIVTGNTLSNIPGIGILVTKFDAPNNVSSIDCVVSGNTIRNAGMKAAGGWGGAGIYASFSSQIAITGNTVNGSWWGGIHLYCSNYTTVSGNTIKNVGKNATSWQGGIVLEYYSKYNVVQGNTVVDTGVGSMEYGIVETGGGTNAYNMIISCLSVGATTRCINVDAVTTQVHLCYNGTLWID